MTNRHSRGELVRLYLDIIVAGVGSVDKHPVIAIRRVIDNKWFQVSDGTWQSTLVDNAMSETDFTNLPGRYHFDFDQALDLAEGSTRYVVKKVNSGPAVLEYEDLVFGQLAGAIAAGLCSVQGTVLSGQADPIAAQVVRATLIPVFKDALGRTAQSDRVLLAFTDSDGDFDLPLIQGATYRLEVPGVGYDRKVLIPAQPSVLFTDL